MRRESDPEAMNRASIVSDAQAMTHYFTVVLPLFEDPGHTLAVCASSLVGSQDMTCFLVDLVDSQVSGTLALDIIFAKAGHMVEEFGMDGVREKVLLLTPRGIEQRKRKTMSDKQEVEEKLADTKLRDVQWRDYAADDPRLVEQMRTVLEALDWPHLALEGTPILNCGSGQAELEDYLGRLASTANNEPVRLKGQAAVRQLLTAGQRRESEIEQATAAALWRLRESPTPEKK